MPLLSSWRTMLTYFKDVYVLWLLADALWQTTKPHGERIRSVRVMNKGTFFLKFTLGNIVWGNLEITLVKNRSGIRSMEMNLTQGNIKIEWSMHEHNWHIRIFKTTHTEFTNKPACNNKLLVIAHSVSRYAAFSHYILIDWLQQFHIQGQLST